MWSGPQEYITYKFGYCNDITEVFFFGKHKEPQIYKIAVKDKRPYVYG